ncbi:MAG: hypothetical protein KC505_01605 [Myxococcales bacterium]|nr:hypothetical protein [Myxococcales bacterium]USN50148.1 MAG: hypothetical protein H6731_07710 [Myxococcales bacterium]
MNYIKYTFFFSFLFLLNACIQQKNNTHQGPSLESDKKAKEVWAHIKSKDFSKKEQAQSGWKKILETLRLPKDKRAPVVQKLVSYRDDTQGIIHKLLKGSINQERSNAIVTMLDDLSNNDMKKAWLEQAHNNEDAMALLLARKNALQDDAPQAIKILLDKILPLDLNTRLAATKIWDVVRRANFAIRDDKRAFAIEVLARLSDMPTSSTRQSIVKALSSKDDMDATKSGLLQSMVQGPIDKELLKICEIFIEDQGDSQAKKNFVNQKLGNLKERALHYLLSLNISKAADGDGPGVRLSTGALASEQPYLNNLITLLTLNGADSGDLYSHRLPQEATDVILDELDKSDDKSVFLKLLEGRTVNHEDLMPIIDWGIRNKNRAEVLKILLTNKQLKLNAKRILKSNAFIHAISTDMETVVNNNNPKKISGGFLGMGKSQELYIDEVALTNFNRLLENDYGLLALIADTDFIQADQGPLIGILMIHTASKRELPLNKRKAVVRTIARTLKAKLPHPGLWQDLVYKKLLNGENSIDILVNDLRISEQEAKDLLLVK